MKPTAADAKAVPALVERFERALGPALTTLELVTDTNGHQVRAQYRVWRWDCPAAPPAKLTPISIGGRYSSTATAASPASAATRPGSRSAARSGSNSTRSDSSEGLGIL